MSTRSGRSRISAIESSPPRTRPSRSPARQRKISPSRKSPPARLNAAKSPSRKSPSRKSSSKYPARKSPARVTKEISEVPPKLPVKMPTAEVAIKLEDLSSKLDSYRTRSKRIEYSVKDMISTQSEFAIDKVNGIEPISEVYGLRNRRSVDEVTPRRSSRLKEFMEGIPDLPEIRRSMSKSASLSKSVSKSVSKSIDTYSDEENSSDDYKKEKSQSVTRKLSTPLRNSINNITKIANRWEFGGRVGSIALIPLIPLAVLSILTACLKECSIHTLINFSPFKTSTIWFSLPALSFITAQVLIQALFTIVPLFGARKDRMDDTGTKQCFNALFSSIFVVHLLFGLHLYGVVNEYSLLGDYIKLATISYSFAVILSIVLYLKSRNVDDNELNPHGNTGYVLYDFFMGKEIHPFIKNLDVKLWVSRICNINTLLLSLLIFTLGIKLQTEEKIDITDYKDVWSKVNFKPTLLVFSMMQIVYILSFITKEYRITSTFYWQSEGLGYLQLVSSSLYPFYFTSISKYVADTDLVLSTNVLVAASVVYLFGFSIMLLSNNIKYEFRRNPLQPGFANLESMPTFHGKKLLVSNLWGIIRHPNYAGDILIHIALSLPGLLSYQVIAASPAIITIFVLLHRAWRDDARCKRRYGAAWQRYCKKVPSVIIPKVL